MSETSHVGTAGELSLEAFNALPRDERLILAGFAVVGGATLSADQISKLAEVADATPLIDDLQRRGLIAPPVKHRYAALAAFEDRIGKTAEALDAGDKLIELVKSLAKGGKLTRARLEEDGRLILGLTTWAAEVEKWQAVLELAQTLQSSYEIAGYGARWIPLGERGMYAALRLGDRESETWFERALAAAAVVGATTTVVADAADSRPRPAVAAAASRTKALWTGGLVLVAVAGLGLGFLVGRSQSNTVTSVLTATAISTRVVTAKPVTVKVKSVRTVRTTVTRTVPTTVTRSVPTTSTVTVVSTNVSTAVVKVAQPAVTTTVTSTVSQTVSIPETITTTTTVTVSGSSTLG